MSAPSPDAPLIAASLPGRPDLAPSASADREPRGFGARYFAASAGIYLAIFAPLLGGLSVKIQSLVPLSQAGTQLGLVTGAGAFFALVSQPIVGRLSDRTTARTGMRRPWILAGVVGTFLSLLVIGIAPSVPVLLIGWCGAQLFSNFAQAALTATLADQVPERRRGRISGLIGASAPIGILIGALGLSLLPTDLLRAAVPGAIGLVAGLLFAFTLKDRVLQAAPGRFDFKAFLASFVFNPRAHRDLGWAWLSKACVMFGYAALTSFLILFLASSFGISDPKAQLQFNLLATLITVAGNVLFAIVGGILSDRLGRRRAFVAAGGALIGVGLAMTAAAPLLGGAGLGLILAAEAVIGTGGGLFLGVDVALCIAVLPNPNDTAKDLGVLNIASTLPQTIAPFVAGVVVIPLGAALLHNGYSLWFAVAAVVAIVGAVLVYRVKSVR